MRIGRADQILSRLESLAGCDVACRTLIPVDQEILAGRNVRHDISNSQGCGVNTREHRGGAWTRRNALIRSISADRSGIAKGTRNASAAFRESETNIPGRNRSHPRRLPTTRPYDPSLNSQSGKKNQLAKPTMAFSLFATRYSLFAYQPRHFERTQQCVKPSSFLMPEPV